MWSELTRKNEDVKESKMEALRHHRMQIVGFDLGVRDIIMDKTAGYKLRVDYTYVGKNVFSGARLFELKATHGVPLEISVPAILNKGKVITWDQFIDQARMNKLWDFQILEMITHAIQDAGMDPDYISGVIARTKLYMLKNPL